MCLFELWFSPGICPVVGLLGHTVAFEKGIQQHCLLSPCLFNLYTEHIMSHAWLDELQDGIKIGRRNINNLRYVDDTTLMAESEEDLKSLLMRVKEESEKASSNLSF